MRALLVGLGAVLALAGVAAAQTPADKLPKRAQCIVDQKPITPTAETPVIYVNGQAQFFCSAGCRTRFLGWPEKYVQTMVVKCTVQPYTTAHMDMARRTVVNNNLYYLCCEPCTGWMREKPQEYLHELKDPVSGHWFKVTEGSPREIVKSQVFLFESAQTKSDFDKDPAKFTVEFKRP
jgi:YHS domain-containing protein